MNLYTLNKNRIVRWFVRFRKRCGYGIHSPFAFNFVTGVIYERGEYYAYQTLLLSHITDHSGLRLKDKRFLFRLANYHQPTNALVLGNDLESVMEYLQYGKQHCKWKSFTTESLTSLVPTLQRFRQLDFLYLDDFNLYSNIRDMIEPYCYDHTLFIFRGIHKTAFSYQTWITLQSDPRVRVTFDLYDFGIVFFEARLNKENYVINYY